MDLKQEIERRRTFAIISHPDAGKTTLTEKLLLYGGAIQLMRSIYKVMTDNGYPASFAYAKAVRSIRSIIDDIDEVGIEEYLTRRASRTL